MTSFIKTRSGAYRPAEDVVLENVARLQNPNSTATAHLMARKFCVGFALGRLGDPNVINYGLLATSANFAMDVEDQRGMRESLGEIHPGSLIARTEIQ